eukprot:scaffold91119_cov35-Attheya_sp.AAC.1
MEKWRTLVCAANLFCHYSERLVSRVEAPGSESVSQSSQVAVMKNQHGICDTARGIYYAQHSP